MFGVQGYEWFRLTVSFQVLREVQRRVLWFRVGGGGVYQVQAT